MIRISITAAAFEAVAATLPHSAAFFEPKTGAKGERCAWIDAAVFARLDAMRRPGESYSDVILRLVELEGRRGV